MDVRVADVYEYIDSFAPFETQVDWDNSGLQVGDKDDVVSRVLFALDIDDKLIERAISSKSNLIITHHPLFFSGIKSIDYGNYKGKLIEKIVKNDINIISAHTNLDLSETGVNYKLAKDIGVKDISPFMTGEAQEFGVCGSIDVSSADSLVSKLETSLGIERGYIRLYGRAKESIDQIALCGGSGVDLIEQIKFKGIDVLITGDVKYHDGQYAYENDILLIDIGHFYSERPVLNHLEELIKDGFPSLQTEISYNSEFVIL